MDPVPELLRAVHASGPAWHAEPAPVHPPWLVGPDEEVARRAFP